MPDGVINSARGLAGKPEWYPEADKLIALCAGGMIPDLGAPEALRTVRDVLEGLMLAYVRGLLSAGDEHEFAYLAVRANELAIEAYREGRS